MVEFDQQRRRLMKIINKPVIGQKDRENRLAAYMGLVRLYGSTPFSYNINVLIKLKKLANAIGLTDYPSYRPMGSYIRRILMIRLDDPGLAAFKRAYLLPRKTFV